MTQYIPDFRRGDTTDIKIQYPTGVDITGYKFWLTLKNNFEDSDADAVYQISTVAGDNDNDDPVHGLVYLTIDIRIEAGKYYWDIQSKSPDGIIKTIAPPISDYKNKVTVIPDITENTT